MEVGLVHSISSGKFPSLGNFPTFITSTYRPASSRWDSGWGMEEDPQWLPPPSLGDGNLHLGQVFYNCEELRNY